MTNSDERASFSRLLEAAKQGDSAALSTVYEEYVATALPQVSRRIQGALRRGFDTLDIGQSVFLEILKDLPRFEDRGEQAFRRWIQVKLRGTLNRQLRQHLRPTGGRREVTLLPEAIEGTATIRADPLEESLRGERGKRLWNAVSALRGPQQTVVLLRQQESLAFAEIAHWMGLPSPDAARKLYARALLRLRTKCRGLS